MKNKWIIYILISCISFDILLAKGFGKTQINTFCTQKSTTIKKGIQPDGNIANKEVINLDAGKYTYLNSGVLLLFNNHNFMLKLPQNFTKMSGTEGNDFLVSGGIVGGCSKEQLSEAIIKNTLNIASFKQIKRYLP
jgi:hypothetical protein